MLAIQVLSVYKNLTNGLRGAGLHTSKYSLTQSVEIGTSDPSNINDCVGSRFDSSEFGNSLKLMKRNR